MSDSFPDCIVSPRTSLRCDATEPLEALLTRLRTLLRRDLRVHVWRELSAEAITPVFTTPLFASSNQVATHRFEVTLRRAASFTRAIVSVFDLPDQRLLEWHRLSGSSTAFFRFWPTLRATAPASAGPASLARSRSCNGLELCSHPDLVPSPAAAAPLDDCLWAMAQSEYDDVAAEAGEALVATVLRQPQDLPSERGLRLLRDWLSRPSAALQRLALLLRPLLPDAPDLHERLQQLAQLPTPRHATAQADVVRLARAQVH